MFSENQPTLVPEAPLSRRPLLHIDNPEALTVALEDAFRHTKHGFSDASMMRIPTNSLRLLGLAKAHQPSSCKRFLKTETRLIKALTHIRNNPAHPWNLNKMAGMSIPHFTELCRNHMGITPSSILGKPQP